MAFKQVPIAYTPTATLTDFTVFVKPSATTGWAAITLAEAQSIRVYSDSTKATELAREIVSADEIHVKYTVPTSGGMLYVDYDGVRADYADTATFGRNNAWDSTHVAVYHLSDASDSTGNGHDGTGINGIVLGGDPTGPLGSGTAFVQASSHYIEIPDSAQLTFNTADADQPFTIMWWANPGTGGSSLVAKYDNNDPFLGEFSLSATSLQCLDNRATNRICITYSNQAQSEWDLFVGTQDGTETDAALNFYRNTAVVSSSALGQDIEYFGMENRSSSLTIGSSLRNSTQYSAYSSGSKDEVRLISGVISSNYHNTLYANQNSPSTFFGTASNVGNFVDLQGSLSSTSATQGDLVLDMGLTGLFQSVSTITGSIDSQPGFAGTLSSQSSASAALDLLMDLQGSVTSTSSISGNLGLLLNLNGALSSTSSISASLSLIQYLQGALNSTSTISGVLDMLGDMTLQGVLSSTSSISGNLELVQNLSGAVQSSSFISGAFSMRQDLNGSLSSSSSIYGAIGLMQNLDGSLHSSSGISGALILDLLLSGTLQSNSQLFGELSGILSKVGYLTAEDIKIISAMAATINIEPGMTKR